MFDVRCVECDREYRLVVEHVRELANIEPGVIAIALDCPRGHRIVLLTGARVAARPTETNDVSLPWRIPDTTRGRLAAAWERLTRWAHPADR